MSSLLDLVVSTLHLPAVFASPVVVSLVTGGLIAFISMGLFGRKNAFVVKDKVCTLFSHSRDSADPFFALFQHCYIGGGSEGLGLSLACQLAQRGAHVTIISRSQAKLDKALAQVEVRCSLFFHSLPRKLTALLHQTHRQSPSQIFQAYSCDLTSSADAASTLHRACAAHSSPAPDHIFACAGGAVPSFFTDLSADKHWECMEWNYRTCLNTIHEGVKAMKESGKEGGRVVVTASIAALMSFAGYTSYSPSKYAIRGAYSSLSCPPSPAHPCAVQVSPRV